MSADEATTLSVHIARLCRGTMRTVEQFLAQPIIMSDLVEMWSDPAGEWARRLDALPLNAGQEARAALTRLAAIAGADGSVLDHGWEDGNGLKTVAAMEQDAASLEALLAPLQRLRKSVGTQRRAA